MKTSWVNFAGWTTDSMGTYPTGKNAHNAAERDVTVFQIAGRNGDLFVDNGRYKNIEVTYPCFVMNFSANEQKIRNVYGSQRNGYQWLEDSYDTTHFRLARFVGQLEFEPVRGDAANFELTFDCDPRRFIKTGQDEIEIEDDEWRETNPSWYPAKPTIIVVDPNQGLEIELTDVDGNVTTFTATDTYSGTVCIDCEKQDIYDYDLGTNLNYLFTLSGEFPSLSWGENVVALTGTYAYAGIIPRWWEL